MQMGEHNIILLITPVILIQTVLLVMIIIIKNQNVLHKMIANGSQQLVIGQEGKFLVLCGLCGYL